jgi:hypothetical protein
VTATSRFTAGLPGSSPAAPALFAPGTGERVAEDEARFLERARTRAFVVDERVTTPAPTV